MMKNSQKPRLRFKGFTDAWEQRKLTELGKIETGNTPPTEIKDYYSDTGMLWVTPTDINSNILQDTERKLTQKGIGVARVIPANSILCTCIASIGKNAFLPVKCAFNQQINALSPNSNNDPYFLFTNSYHWSQIMKKGAGGLTFQIVNKTEFSNIKTFVPNLKEQTVLGNLFYILDNLITLHQRKYDKLSNMKKAFLEKMFPQDNENTPKLRFKGFTDTWEQRKLGELGEFKSNGVNKKSNPDEHPVNLLNYMDVYNRRKITKANSCDLMKVTAKTTQIKENSVEKNDVFFTPTSETAEDIGHVMVIEETLPNTVYSYHLVRFRPFENMLFPSFPNYGFASEFVRKQLILSAQGVQRFVINKRGFEETLVMLPIYEEQEKISILLTNLDNLITLHQRKLEKLKNIKKACLERMFV